jgi:hypothetical protein
MSTPQRDHTKRMGRTMPFTSADGDTHDASFWVLNYLATAIGDRAGRIEFIGYSSVAHYGRGADPIAGATRAYQFNGDEFDAAVFQPTSLPIGSPIAAEILAMAWSIALAAKEVGDPPAEGQQDTRISFFAQSVAV